MKRSTLWIFCLVLAGLSAHTVHGEFFVLSGPEYLSNVNWLYGNHKQKEMYCISNEPSSALIWNQNLDWVDSSLANLDQVDKSKEFPGNNDYVYPTKDALTCQMSHTSQCTNWKREGDWKFVTSLIRPMSPVTDNRWEDFQQIKLTNRFEILNILPKTGSLSISIRGKSDAHFAICDGNKVSQNSCFYIVLGGWKNTMSVIRKCERGIPDLTTEYPTGECAKPLVVHNDTVLSSTEWRTFTIKWDFESQTKISVFDSDSIILKLKLPRHDDYSMKEKKVVEGTNYFLHARSAAQMLLKLHLYTYSIATMRKSELTSPEIMSTSGNFMCVEMSISLCEKCLMLVDFIDRNGMQKPAGTFQNKVSNDHYGLPIWQNVKINKTLSINNQQMQQPIKLVIRAFVNNNTKTGETFWAIANIRRCYHGVLKAVKIKVFQDSNANYYWPNVTCQKISPDGTTSVIEANNIEPNKLRGEFRPLCSRGKIGPTCSANCSSLFPENNDCRKLLSCDRYGCSCAPGFLMPKCENDCPDLKYGFECSQDCGNCAQNKCDFATGECLYGCGNTENNYFLPPFCKIGVGSPPAPNVDLIHSSCVRLFLDIKKEYKVIPTNVTFEIWANSSNSVFQSESIQVQNNTVTIETYAEHLKPGTHYKVIGLLHAGKRTFRGDWGNFTTSCTESVALNFVMTANETTITLDNWVDVHVNDSCPFTWYRVQFLKGNEMLFDNSTVFPKVFNDLEPFTQYRIIVKSDKTNIVDKFLTTLEGTPDPVEDLKIASVYTDEVRITWNPPNVPRGKIVNYTVEIQPIESLGCTDSHEISYNSSTSESLKMKSVLMNTSRFTYDHTFNDLKPYTKYLVTVYAHTARHQGENSTVKFTTESTVIPTEVFTKLHLSNESPETSAGILKWNLPEDCTSITGPIRASKLSFKKTNINMTHVLSGRNFIYPLEKSIFNGAETSEVDVYVLRDTNTMENETAYTNLKFTTRPRAPPPVYYIEIVEVDTHNQTITLRWKPPSPPIHGELEYYSLMFCKDNQMHCHENQYLVMHSDGFCDLWNFENVLCTSIPLPAPHYDHIYIRAYNRNVTESSDPVGIVFNRTEFVPMAPPELFINVIENENATINVTWSHPLKSGGKVDKFTIVARMTNSSLKFKPWLEKIDVYDICNTGYQAEYNTELNLLPSSTFSISVRAITSGGLTGEKIESKINIPTYVDFNIEDMKPKADNDLMIRIRIPRVVYDIQNSSMVIVVQGPRFCDEGESNNQDVDLYLDSQSSSYYKVAWKAATLTNPEDYADKEFEIGDGQTYGDSKNYALCPMESYIVHLVLVDEFGILHTQRYSNEGKNILKTIKTSAIVLGEQQKNYVMWLTPLFFVLLITLLLVFIMCRKKLVSQLITSKSKTSQQENMPLSNDFSKKKSIDEIEAAMKIKETKGLPNNNIIIVDRKREFLMPVKVEEFGDYFEYAYKSGLLEKEYSMVKNGPTKPCTYGSMSGTKPKNRYANLFPYDESRVVLEKLPDDPHSDYINANFITGYGGREKAYIATQGPKPNTVIDFWRMIWQEKVQIICMMANVEENGKIKCEQYWPSAVGKKILYGTISVQYASEEIHSDFTYRTLRVYCKNNPEDTRMIEHLHYTAWPDHGVPSNPRSIVSFLKEIQKHSPAPRNSNDPPIVVHCSAGVGRTGTLIVLDMSICRAFSENVIDVYANVLSVRKERMNLVDNTEQYLLVHLVLVEYLNSENICFTCDKSLPSRIADAKRNSRSLYQRILETSWWNEVLGSPPIPAKTLSDRNRAKHRFPETAVTSCSNRLYLKRTIITDEDSDYIAATNVKKLFKNRSYITTQLPLPTTSVDFWRMLSEHDVEYVLVLQLPNLLNPTYCELVPENQEFGNTKYLKIIRQECLIPATQYYFVEEVLIINSAEPSKEQKVKIINYKNWPESSLPPAEDLIKLWKFTEKLMKDNCPFVVACRDGVTASGIWLASSFLLKRMEVDKECDVSQAVQAVRRRRKDFLNKPEYLEYLYDVALEWFEEAH